MPVLVAKLLEVPGKSLLLKRIAKKLRKNAALLQREEVLFYSRENHRRDSGNPDLEESFSRAQGDQAPVSEERHFAKLCSKLQRELEKAVKRTQPEPKPRAKKLKSGQTSERKAQEWKTRLWWNLHGPGWLQHPPYLHSLASFYKSNPLDPLMSIKGKSYVHTQSEVTHECMELLSRKFSWVDDAEQTLEDFDIRAIFPENLQCEASLKSMFVPFRFTPAAALADSDEAAKQGLSAEGKPDSAQKQLFWTQSETVLKAILKFYRKNHRGLKKESAAAEEEFFEPLSLWHQKCLVAMLPFGYCGLKDYCLVGLTQNRHVTYCARYVLEDQARLGSALAFLGGLVESVAVSRDAYKAQAREVFGRLKFFLHLWNDVLCNLSRDGRAPRGKADR